LNIWRNKRTFVFNPYTEEEYNFYYKISQENAYMNEVQRTHYLDEGCTCKACEIKRSSILERINRGENVNEKIIHNQAKIEYVNRRARDMRVVRVQTKPRQSTTQQKMRSTFGGSIQRPGGNMNINLTTR